MKQGVIYTRFSPRPNAGDSRSADLQEKKCREYCNFHEIDIIGVFSDLGISGKNMERPGFQKALDMVCKQRCILVVYTMARMARSTKNAIEIMEILNKNHADLAIVTQRVDTTTPMGRAFFKLAALFAELERETTAERTKIMLRDMQESGIRVSKIVPYGFMTDPKDDTKIMRCEEEQNILELMIQYWKHEHLTFSEIGRKLLYKGYKPRTAAKWSNATISKLLRRELPKDPRLNKRRYYTPSKVRL